MARYFPAEDEHATLHAHVSVHQAPGDDLLFEQSLLETGRLLSANLFIYLWSDPVLVLGRAQDMAAVDISICQSERIPVLRRRSGGAAVLHNRTLNIALMLPSDHAWAQSIRGLYAQFISLVSKTLEIHGIAAEPSDGYDDRSSNRSAICFESHTVDSLLINRKKVFGCAQRRLRHATLVHGTLFVGLDIPQQSRVFGVPESRIDHAMTAIPDGLDPIAIAADLVGAAAARLGKVPMIRFINTSDHRNGSADHPYGMPRSG